MEVAHTAPDAWPAVSVVVPTVQRPAELRRAVASILGQDYPGPIECLVVFDGTEPIAPDVAVPTGRTLRVLANSRTPGLPGNRNTGYLAASGDLVAACDDDDEWLPRKLSAQVARLQEHPEAVLCATGIRIQRAERAHVRTHHADQLTLQDLLRHRHVETCPSSSLFRRRLIDEGILVDESIRGGYAEDYEWLFRVVRAGPVHCIREVLTIIHWGEESFFVSDWTVIEHGLRHLLDVVPEFHRDPVGLARIEGQIALALAARGERGQAARLAARSLRRSPRARQSWAALLVAAGAVSADRIASIARDHGRGV